MSEPTSSPVGGNPTTDRPGETAPKPVAAAPAATKPPVASKPAAKGKPGDDRRGFVFALIGSPFAAAWTFFSFTMLAWVLGTLRFLFPNVLAEPPSKVKVGFPETYEEGKVVEKYKDQNIWVVKNEGKIYALSTTCTHLGCTPNWLESAQKFKCPCHGSGFYISGINFEGPAPRPLERWALIIGDDGQIIVDKSKKFQQERGEWSNPESFITV